MESGPAERRLEPRTSLPHLPAGVGGTTTDSYFRDRWWDVTSHPSATGCGEASQKSGQRHRSLGGANRDVTGGEPMAVRRATRLLKLPVKLRLGVTTSQHSVQRACQQKPVRCICPHGYIELRVSVRRAADARVAPCLAIAQGVVRCVQ